MPYEPGKERPSVLCDSASQFSQLSGAKLCMNTTTNGHTYYTCLPQEALKSLRGMNCLENDCCTVGSSRMCICNTDNCNNWKDSNKVHKELREKGL